MLSNLMNQLKQQNKLDKLDDVLKEVPNVRKDCGYPPLVTPSSQIVGTQAVLNVLSGERYKMVTKEFKGLLKGEYGKLPANPDPEVVKKVVKDEKIITCRPADLIKPEYEKYKNEVAEYSDKTEDIFSTKLLSISSSGDLQTRRASIKIWLKTTTGYIPYENFGNKR